MSENNLKIAMYDLEGNFLETLEGKGFSDIARQVKIKSPACISKCVKGEIIQSHFRQFRIVKNDNVIEKLPSAYGHNQGSKRNVIHKFYKGKYICTYNDMYEAEYKTGIKQNNISVALSNNKTAGGFNWYKAELFETLIYIGNMKNPFIK
jgi:hypothetical protein